MVVTRINFYAMSDLSSFPAPKEASTFASLLASLTGGTNKSSDLWDDSALADDVSTISYEQALRSHRRVPPAESLTVYKAADKQACTAAEPAAATARKKRKTASITIRLTREEETQLHDRAAAAQLSVSAYLRSCIFEAESLRAQVKEALLQIRSTAQADPSSQSQSRPPSSWRSRLLPHWRRSASG
jgi:hypothetical protein